MCVLYFPYSNSSKFTPYYHIPSLITPLAPDFLITTRFSETFHLTAVRFAETLSVKFFPFAAVTKCFRSEDYEAPITTFAGYYFSMLERSQRVDTTYGPLSPLILAIYHNDTKLLETMLDEHFFPKRVDNYWSPLEYSFRQGYNSNTKVGFWSYFDVCLSI